MLVWPAGGIGLAAFLLFPKRLWPVLIVSFYFSGIIADIVLAGRSFLTSLGYMTANISESTGSAWLILFFSRDFHKFSRIREVLSLIAATIFINAISACIGAATSVFFNSANFTIAWRSWYIADGLGILLITPLIVVWMSGFKRFIKSLNLKIILEGIAFLFIWLLISWLIFYPNQSNLFDFHPYFLVALLAWPAMRFGQRGITLALILLLVVAIFSPSIINGPTPWSAGKGNDDSKSFNRTSNFHCINGNNRISYGCGF